MTDQTTVDELKSCPFCGGAGADNFEILYCHGTILHPAYAVECGECGAMSRYSDIDHFAAWNRRTPTPPSDDLRAAMEALREGGNPTNNTIDDAYIGRMFDNCNAVLAAWDAQQGERS